MTVFDNAIRTYFSQSFEKHGMSAEGVDWNGPKGHYLRLGALVSEIDARENFSINDIGCGFGSLLNALFGAGKLRFNYYGYDLVEEMVEAAKTRWTLQDPRLTFVKGGVDRIEEADYTIASGTFNMKQDVSAAEWQNYVIDCLEKMLEKTHCKLAVNFLTSYSEPGRMRDDLYYPDPRVLFDFGMSKTGSAAIKHNYGLYDFTLVINKNHLA